jgi:dTDP-glucose pyrophosphorylase
MNKKKQDIQNIVDELYKISDFIEGDNGRTINTAISLIEQKYLEENNTKEYIVYIRANSIEDIDNILGDEVGININSYYILTEDNESLANHFISPEQYVERNMADVFSMLLQDNTLMFIYSKVINNEEEPFKNTRTR